MDTIKVKNLSEEFQQIYVTLKKKKQENPMKKNISSFEKANQFLLEKNKQLIAKMSTEEVMFVNDSKIGKQQYNNTESEDNKFLMKHKLLEDRIQNALKKSNKKIYKRNIEDIVLQESLLKKQTTLDEKRMKELINRTLTDYKKNKEIFCNSNDSSFFNNIHKLDNNNTSKMNDSLHDKLDYSNNNNNNNQAKPNIIPILRKNSKIKTTKNLNTGDLFKGIIFDDSKDINNKQSTSKSKSKSKSKLKKKKKIIVNGGNGGGDNKFFFITHKKKIEKENEDDENKQEKNNEEKKDFIETLNNTNTKKNKIIIKSKSNLDNETEIGKRKTNKKVSKQHININSLNNRDSSSENSNSTTKINQQSVKRKQDHNQQSISFQNNRENSAEFFLSPENSTKNKNKANGSLNSNEINTTKFSQTKEYFHLPSIRSNITRKLSVIFENAKKGSNHNVNVKNSFNNANNNIYDDDILMPNGKPSKKFIKQLTRKISINIFSDYEPSELEKLRKENQFERKKNKKMLESFRKNKNQMLFKQILETSIVKMFNENSFNKDQLNQLAAVDKDIKLTSKRSNALYDKFEAGDSYFSPYDNKYHNFALKENYNSVLPSKRNVTNQPIIKNRHNNSVNSNAISLKKSHLRNSSKEMPKHSHLKFKDISNLDIIDKKTSPLKITTTLKQSSLNYNRNRNIDNITNKLPKLKLSSNSNLNDYKKANQNQKVTFKDSVTLINNSQTDREKSTERTRKSIMSHNSRNRNEKKEINHNRENINITENLNISNDKVNNTYKEEMNTLNSPNNNVFISTQETNNSNKHVMYSQTDGNFSNFSGDFSSNTYLPPVKIKGEVTLKAIDEFYSILVNDKSNFLDAQHKNEAFKKDLKMKFNFFKNNY